MGGVKRLQPKNISVNGRPLVVLLVGNHQKGAMALAAGRWLLLRGVRVVVLIVRDGIVIGEPVQSYSGNIEMTRMRAQLKEQLMLSDTTTLNDLTPAVLTQLHSFVGLHGEWIHAVDALPNGARVPVDFIIDGLVSHHVEPHIASLLFPATSTMLTRSIQWANGNKAPTVSIDLPSGMDGTTGRPLISLAAQATPGPQSPIDAPANLLSVLFNAPSSSSALLKPTRATFDAQQHWIHPKFTLAVGLPKLALLKSRLRSDTVVSERLDLGEVYLADAMLPPFIIKSVLDASNQHGGGVDKESDAIQRFLQQNRAMAQLSISTRPSLAHDDRDVTIISEPYSDPFGDKFIVRLDFHEESISE
jgi:NAD(P)H-hydrate repair Nnr-like enzyme with NAD(P)H-hydrate epimerase domain